MGPDTSPSSSRWVDLRHDAFASVVVFLVALPLCMGIAVASGAPPAAGIITGIIGGLIVGALAGSPLQVSGPAAGLTVIVYEIIQEHGVEKLAIVVMLAGIIQMKWAWLQLGQWFRAVSPAVVHGMLAGIGVLIFASQFHIMIDDTPRGSGLANLITLPSAFWKGLVADDATPLNHHLAGRIGLLTIVAIVLWNLYAPRMLKAIPSVLIGVALATVAAMSLNLDIAHVKVRDNLLTIVQLPSLHSLQYLMDPAIIGEALALALIASVETLLSATAVDQLHTGPRTRYNKELFAQGAGNVLCGLLGALPVTGVIVRSAANVEAGARSRAATLLHGGWLLLFVFFLPAILRMIPTAALGAVLVFTGYKLMNVGIVKELKRYGRSEVLIYGATLCTIVATNLLTGVLIGIGLAMAKLLYTTQNLETHFEHDPENGKLTLNLMGIGTFVSLPRLATALEGVPPLADLQIQFTSLRHIDHACLNLLESWQKLHEATGGQVHLDWNKLHGISYHVRKGPRSATWWQKWLE
ncbi:MAG: SulP family inorganic anion transporter [Nitrospirota bacterium]|nr:SulP family inorganic anion transporter [Nitrospirota bacterium]